LATIAPGINSYTAINNGNAATTVAYLAAITGLPASSYWVNANDVAKAWQAGQLIVLGTGSTPLPSYIESNHAYAMVGYTPSSALPFSLFNPWGVQGGVASTGQFYYGQVVVNSAAIGEYCDFSAQAGTAAAWNLLATSSAALGIAAAAMPGLAANSTTVSDAQLAAGVAAAPQGLPVTDGLLPAWSEYPRDGSAVRYDTTDGLRRDELAGALPRPGWALPPAGLEVSAIASIAAF
jgi:hypothetical protein